MAIVAFILFLGPLIFVHELGHFLFAKLFNIRVDVFSIGFGPKILKKKWGETEYALSPIPLGGYVKIFGEDPTAELTEEEKKRALYHQAKYKRFLVIFGGPLFNILFTIFIFLLVLGIGKPELTSKIGKVLTNSTSYQAGLRTGDRVLEVEGQPVSKFKEMVNKISKTTGDTVNLLIEKEDGSKMNLAVPTKKSPSMNQFGEPISASTLEGIYFSTTKPIVNISNPNSVAGKAGLKSDQIILGYRIESEGSEENKNEWIKVKSYEDIEALFIALPSELSGQRKISFQVAESEKKMSVISIVEINYDWSSADKSALPGSVESALGIHSNELVIDSVKGDTPADKAGLKNGDRIISAAGQKLRAFEKLKTIVQDTSKAGKPVPIEFERNGVIQTFKIKAEEKTSKDLMGKKIVDYQIGISPKLKFNKGEMVVHRITDPVMLVSESLRKTWRLTRDTMVMYKKLIFGEVSAKNLGGPLLIGKVASDSLNVGLTFFFELMAMISINLAILNLLPVPVLDGGHLMFLGIEAVIRKPLSAKKIEIAHQVGLTLLIALMVFAFYNDITRMVDFDKLFN